MFCHYTYVDIICMVFFGGGGGRKRGYKPLKLGFGMIASAEAKTTNTLNYYLIIQVPICLCYC